MISLLSRTLLSMAVLYQKRTAAKPPRFPFCPVSGIRSVGGHRTDLAFLDAILDDRLRDALRNGLVLLEDHREASAALGDRADGVGVAEHLAQRNRRLEELDSGTVLHPFDASAALVDGAAGGAQ